ncbi:unnamed protein product [Penicillium olsonii]|nr:unnamed protein product [Penicillium olsonii]CAG7930061.1 unnamed protein product [Penicillium olsonii]
MRPVSLLPLLGASALSTPINETRNANHIFNAIQDSMRQWGSSLHHNGVSYFLARVPAGTQFYHGTSKDTPVTGTEWLAFEPEHAMVFARLRGPPPPSHEEAEGEEGHRELRKRDGFERYGPPHQPPPEMMDSKAGYLHTYAAKKDLRLLYVDGMSAAKTDKGTLESQDLVLFNGLLDDSPHGGFQENERAKLACELAANEWEGRIDGILRMEAGFEIILCDFERDLDSVRITQVKQETRGGPPGGPGPMEHGHHGEPRKEDHGMRDAPGPHDRDMEHRRGPRKDNKMRHANGRDGEDEISRHRPGGPGGPGGPAHGPDSSRWMRAVTARYDGIGGNRVSLNFDHFVSAFSYDTDLFQGKSLPRLSNLSQKDLISLRDEVTQLIKAYHPAEVCEDWQAISDMIVTRYSKQISYFGSGKITSLSKLQDEIETLMAPFIDFANRDPRAEIERCALQFMPEQTLIEDSLAGAAIYGVAKRICSSLFEAHDQKSLKKAVRVVQDLMHYLNWATWKQCKGCEDNEICVVPIWPMGTVEDYEHPKCKDADNPFGQGGESYWGGFH